MGLPGKPNGITGADVDRYYREGRIREIAEYCESDVLNTFRVWLRYELFRGGLSYEGFRKSEDMTTQARSGEFIPCLGCLITERTSFSG
jgi:hypothetical protein